MALSVGVDPLLLRCAPAGEDTGEQRACSYFVLGICPKLGYILVLDRFLFEGRIREASQCGSRHGLVAWSRTPVDERPRLWAADEGWV